MTGTPYGDRPSPSKLYRDPEHGIIMGVAAGIADYFGISRTTVRIVMVLALVFFTLPTFFGYLIAAFAVKPKPDGLYTSSEDEEFWRRTRVDPKRTVADIQQKFRTVERRIRQAEAYVTSSEFKLKRDFKEL
ncbi:MAG: envelope stress response membrane protein PspC [Rhodospirillales bacterium]|nr:envelope stress response membrane protein PspC [Rhodospirillales bacterium]